jgi:hypothetical protein
MACRTDERERVRSVHSAARQPRREQTSWKTKMYLEDNIKTDLKKLEWVSVG